MPYPERIYDASYISPSGDEILFDFEVVSRDITHRIGSFEFSGVNGTLHQDKGISGEIYPLTVYIHGPDYDLEADRFIEMAKETGPGFLYHPRWGRKRVQILSITQSENLVQGAGQATFTVQLQETLEREFPKTGVASEQLVIALADGAQADAIGNFADQIDVDLLDEPDFEDEIISSANSISDTLSSVISASQEAAATFRGYIDNIINNANDLIQAPFELATNITSAIRVVTEIPGRISSRLQGVQNLLNVVNLRSITDAVSETKNALLLDELVGTAATAAASEAINQTLNQSSKISKDSKGKATISVPDADTGFQSREEVLSAVVYLQTISNDLINKLDEGQTLFKSNLLSETYIQSVQSYIPIWQLGGTVIKAGLDLSFSLPIKRSIVLATSRTILDLCYEFYKNIDDVTLDYLILTNSLTGDDIIEVPRGKEIIIYE